MADQDSAMRVEISGWDLSEQFFVERGILRSEEEVEQKKLTIHRQVRVGGLVFLRLLDNTQPGMAFPVAYRVRELRPEESPGAFEIYLRQMWPRAEAAVPGQTLRLDASRPAWLGIK